MLFYIVISVVEVIISFEHEFFTFLIEGIFGAIVNIYTFIVLFSLRESFFEDDSPQETTSYK
jgi:putative flippase GtrA